MPGKREILELIARTAKDNGGVPLGSARFRSETGIKETDWCGKYWARWGDALIEAGFSPNAFQQAYNSDFMMEKLAMLARELGRFPTSREIQLQTRFDKTFPNKKTFQRLGSKATLAETLSQFCTSRAGYEDVGELCAALFKKVESSSRVIDKSDAEVFGSVYLLKSGRHFKIGRSNAVGRRERELQIQLPEKAALVHSINTDDPAGIEAYWHRRFESKRGNGEWFDDSNAHARTIHNLAFDPIHIAGNLLGPTAKTIELEVDKFSNGRAPICIFVLLDKELKAV